MQFYGWIHFETDGYVVCNFVTIYIMIRYSSMLILMKIYFLVLITRFSLSKHILTDFKTYSTFKPSLELLSYFNDLNLFPKFCSRVMGHPVQYNKHN